MSGSILEPNASPAKTTGDVWNELETRDRAELTRMQDELLPGRIQKAYEEGGLHREVYDAAGVGPDDWTGRGDLASYPLINKDMVKAFRAKTGDPFGGLSAGMVPGSSVAHGSGTSGGVPTMSVSTAADRQYVADELASWLWLSGVREGTRILSIPSFGVRTEPVLPLASAKLGAVHVFPDNAASSLYQLEYVRPQLSWAYPGWLDGLKAAATAAGKDLDALLEPLQILWFGGKYVSPLRRTRLEERVGATLFEVGGMGDIGLHTCSCSAHEGMHLRDDLFVVETVDPETGQPLPAGTQGELVFTALAEEGMNFVRWRSDDMGLVKVEPCSCGRTCSRVYQLGRVWERTVVDGQTVMPSQIDDILYELAESDVPFQIVRSKDGSRAPFLRVAPPGRVSLSEITSAVRIGIQAEIEVRQATAEEIVGPTGTKLGFKYAQIKDA